MASNNVIRIQIKRFSFYKCNSPFIYCNFSQFNNYKAALRAQPRINALDLAFIHMKYPFYIYTKHPKLEAWHSGTINLPHFASTIARRTSRNLCLNWIWKENNFCVCASKTRILGVCWTNFGISVGDIVLYAGLQHRRILPNPDVALRDARALGKLVQQEREAVCNRTMYSAIVASGWVHFSKQTEDGEASGYAEPHRSFIADSCNYNLTHDDEECVCEWVCVLAKGVGRDDAPSAAPTIF